MHGQTSPGGQLAAPLQRGVCRTFQLRQGPRARRLSNILPVHPRADGSKLGGFQDSRLPSNIKHMLLGMPLTPLLLYFTIYPRPNDVQDSFCYAASHHKHGFMD